MQKCPTKGPQSTEDLSHRYFFGSEISLGRARALKVINSLNALRSTLEAAGISLESPGPCLGDLESRCRDSLDRLAPFKSQLILPR